MRLLYKPFAIIAGFIASRVGKAVFGNVWSAIDDAPPPVATTGEASAVKVIGAQALQAAVMAGTRAGVDRAFARSFYYLIGIWPGKSPKPPKNDDYEP
jgi:hypothetical protein